MFIAAQFTIGKTWNQPQCPLTEEWIRKMCICVVRCLVAQSCPTLCNPMDYSPPGSSVHWDSSGKDTGVCCHALLQGNFPSQGLNAGLPLCRCILYHLSHQGSPPVYIVRLNWHITLCKFKVQNVFIWYTYYCSLIITMTLDNTTIPSHKSMRMCIYLFSFSFCSNHLILNMA